MSEIFIILACVPLYVTNAFCDKFVSTKDGNKNIFLYNCIKFFIGAIALFPFLFIDSKPIFTMGALICGIGCGVMYAVSKTLILKGYELSSVAFMTLCHSAGMILPCILGHLLWSEKLTVVSIFGILLTVLSIVLLKGGSKEKAKLGISGIIIGLIVFISSGSIMIIQKLMAIYYASDSVTAYNFYSFVAAALILIFLVKPRGEGHSSRKYIIPAAIGSAISLSVISMVMTSLAGRVPSAILFPSFNGLGITLVSLGSVFAFGEKLTVKRAFGLIIGLIGLCLINL